MVRFLALCLLITSSVVASAQKKQINRILSEVNDGNFSEAEEKILQFETKEGASPELRFVQYIYFKKRLRNRYDLDSAYIFSRMAFEGLSSLEIKEKEKLCKDFDFCQSIQATVYQELDSLIFRAYSSNLSRDLIVEYRKKYSGSVWTKQASILIDSLDFIQIINVTDISVLRNYIKDHPVSVYNETVQNKIYQSAFDQAVNAKDVTAMEQFVINYPGAPQAQLAGKMIEDAYWNGTLASGKKEDFDNFIDMFPASSNVSEARKRIWNIVWSETESLNTVSAYKDFYDNYPNAPQAAEAKKRYEAARENVLPFLTREKKYRLFDIETSQFIGTESYDAISILNQGLFIVSKYKKYGLVDKSGETIIPITYNCINTFGNFLKVQLGEKYALFDFKGEKVVDFLYENLFLDKGYINAKTKNVSDTGKTQIDILDKSGNRICSGRLYDLSVVNDSVFIASVNKNKFLVNRDMKTLSAKYDWITPTSTDLLIANLGGKSGLISAQGKVVVPITFETINHIDSFYFVATNTLKQDALLDAEGRFMINAQPKSIQSLGEGMFSLTLYSGGNTTGSTQLYDARKGEFVSGNKFEEVVGFSGGFSIAMQDEKCGIIDREGRWKVAPLYAEEMRYRNEEMYGDGHEGMDYLYYDEEEAESLPYCQPFNGKEGYDAVEYYSGSSAGLFNDDLAIVQIESAFGYVNSKGDVKIPIMYSNAMDFSHGIAQVTLEEGNNQITQVINRSGKTIMNNASILYFLEKGQKALLMSGEEYYILTLKDHSLSKFKVVDGFSYLMPAGDFFVGNYKEKDVVVLSTGEDLMAPAMDFSTYDFKQEVLSANTKYLQGEYDEAISKYRSLYSQRPSSFTVNFMLAKCYSEKKDNYNFETYLDRAIELKPENEEARGMRLDHNYERKEWRKVINDANILLSSSNYFDANLYFRRAYANAEIGNEIEAFNDYSAVIQNNSGYSSAYNNRGIIYLKRKQYALAVADFNNAIKETAASDTESLGLYYSNKGNALYSLNKKADACAAWRKGDSYGNTSAKNNARVYCR